MISSNKKIYFVLVIWIIFFAVLIEFGFLPFVKELKRSSQELAFQKKAQDLFQFQIENFKNLQENFPTFQPIIEKIDSSFVAEEVPIEFIEFLEYLTGDAGTSIKISPLRVTRSATDPWTPVGFNVFLEGPFPNCLRVLERLEQGPWFIEISKLDVGETKENVSFLSTFKVFSGTEEEK